MGFKETTSLVSMWIKVLTGFVLSKLFKSKGNRRIILTGGNLGEKYEDSIAVFHQYLLEHYSKTDDIYWLYDPKTTYAKEMGLPNAVPLGTIRNYYLFFCADYSFHGHSIMYDITPKANSFLFLNKKTFFVHVSHGIEGFKKILIQKEDVPLLARTNHFNCASRYEKKLKREQWGIPEHKLVVTGFPRFDRYPTNQPADQVKKILFMTTWREWLTYLSDEEFEESAYFQHTMELLEHEEINRLLKAQNVLVTVALHPFMKKFEQHFREFTNDRIQFVGFDELSIGKAIQEMDMLLTDITSISWDFLYLNKPIIFYLFDQTDWETKRGIYINLNKELYGYKAQSSDEVYAYLKEILVEGVNYNKWYSEAHRYFDYFDQNNCERLTAQVLKESK